MVGDYKKILIVDDSEIDREILKSILCQEFDIIEADNGFTALEIILREMNYLDAIMLDVSMPVLDGFSVLRFMKENKIGNIPVFLITAEATKDNVEKAVKYNVSEFIGKPFEREEILRRLKVKLGIIGKHNLTESDVRETNKYISDLEAVYNKYLTNLGEDSGHYKRMVDLMKILLNRYSVGSTEAELNSSQIEIISKAAFFCDMGNMLIPSGNFPTKSVKQDDTGNDIDQSHTTYGADIVRLNSSKHCEYFVQICADMCIHHHERYDGKGYPHRIFGNNILIYTQMCWLVDQFDSLFFKYREHNELQFDFVVNEIAQDTGAVSEEVLTLLVDAKFNIVMYYNSKY